MIKGKKTENLNKIIILSDLNIVEIPKHETICM